MDNKKDAVMFEMATDDESITRYCGSNDGLRIGGPSCKDWERANLKPDTKYAVRMTAIPDGYNLGTLDDWDVDGAKAWASGSFNHLPEWLLCSDVNYKGLSGLVIIPIESEQEATARRNKEEAMERLSAMEAEAAKLRTTIEGM